MQSIYETYLKIIKNTCSGSALPVCVSPEDKADIARLAEEHCTVPFVLPYCRHTSIYPVMLQRTKSMMLNYLSLIHI